MDSSLGPYRLMADLLDSLHLGVCLFDDSDRTLLWNRRFLRLFPEHAGQVHAGEPYAANLRRFYANRLTPEEMAGIEERIAEGIARHRAQSAPFIFEHGGQWVRVASQPVPGIGRIRIWTPIAPPEATADPASCESDTLKHEVMPFAAMDGGDGVLLADAGGRVTWANARSLQFFGLARPEQATGRALSGLYAGVWDIGRGAAAPAEIAASLRTLAEAEHFAGAPFELPLPGGRWVRILQQRAEDNTICTTLADITATKRLQAELSRAREVAEAANRAKDDFLATVSHELRTPMNGILGMLALLEDSRLEPDQRGRLGMARSSAEALLGLLDDILTFSRNAAGRVVADELPASPAQILAQISELLRPRAAEKRLGLRLDLHPDLPETVLCDPARLRQVVLNLVGNAVKFTDRGEVVVCARPGGALGDGRMLLEFEVADTGIGIPAAALPGVFEQFVQADSSIGRKFGGTGLGLAICRQLVRLMGGAISAESVEGVGSRFRFTIACRTAALARAAVAPAILDQPVEAVPTAALRVLVVDDHPINRDVARLYLERLDCRVRTAADGPEAVAAAGAEPFDLVLMDLQMPGMDGFEATRAIRAGGGASAATPVLALTAHAGEEMRARCLAAGMQGFIAKPIRRELLVAEMAAARRATPRPPDAGLLDGERIADVVGGLDPMVWTRALRDFETHARSVVAQLAAAAVTPGGPPCRDAAHGLKGLAWNLGAQRFGDLVGSLEQLPGPALADRLPELGTLLEDTLAALRGIQIPR